MQIGVVLLLFLLAGRGLFGLILCLNMSNGTKRT
jgi:hypothetical protein